MGASVGSLSHTCDVASPPMLRLTAATCFGAYAPACSCWYTYSRAAAWSLDQEPMNGSPGMGSNVENTWMGSSEAFRATPEIVE